MDRTDWRSEQNPLNDKIFEYLMRLQQQANQLRMNHWQTESYAEHKATDELIGEVYSFVDELAESTMGQFGRPKINTTHLTVSDIGITSTKWVIESICADTEEMLAELKVTPHEGLIALTGDFHAVVKKFLYLITLG